MKTKESNCGTCWVQNSSYRSGKTWKLKNSKMMTITTRRAMCCKCSHRRSRSCYGSNSKAWMKTTKIESSWRKNSCHCSSTRMMMTTQITKSCTACRGSLPISLFSGDMLATGSKVRYYISGNTLNNLRMKANNTSSVSSKNCGGCYASMTSA